MDVRVQAPQRIAIDRIDVLVNGTAAATLRRSAGTDGFAAAPAQFADEVPLSLDRDGFVIVVASGTGPNLGRRGEGAAADRVEAAFSNPIWVDVGGDGYLPSRPSLRDTLVPRLPPAQRAELEARLRAAILAENFELAAILRDELRLM